jgi:hypothetical protein
MMLTLPVFSQPSYPSASPRRRTSTDHVDDAVRSTIPASDVFRQSFPDNGPAVAAHARPRSQEPTRGSSLMILSAMRSASAEIVSDGFTPSELGSTEASAT